VLACWLMGGAPADATRPDAEPVKPPKDAIILFNGKDTAAWQHAPEKPFAWNLADSVMEVKPRTGGLITKEKFRDFHLHVEFNVPSMPDKKGQGKGNSGVYIHGLYEIQILDNTDNPTYPAGGCGSIYRQKDPDKDVSKKAGEWQSYDITFRAPRFEADDRVKEKPRLTLVWNGVKVHDNVEIAGPTSARAKDRPLVREGTITLQDHGTPVKFRNIWIINRQDAKGAMEVRSEKAHSTTEAQRHRG
jgi:hypothetical protein